MKRTYRVKCVFSAVGKGVFAAISAVAILFVGATCYSKFIKKERVPSVFGYAVLVVETPSMSGKIEVGDAVLLRKTKKIKVEDIVAYTPVGKDYTVTHRVKEITPEGNYILKGDFNEDEDKEAVAPSRVVGKVVSIWPNTGKFFYWIQGYGVYVILFLVLIGVCGFFALDAWKEGKKKE
jgi:signal peptidase I